MSIFERILPIVFVSLISCGLNGENNGARSESFVSQESNIEHKKSKNVSSISSKGLKIGNSPKSLAYSQSSIFEYDIPHGAQSVSFLVNGGIYEKFVVISSLRGPDGTLYISEDWNDIDPMGKTATQWPAWSTKTFTVPHASYTAVLPGRWQIVVGCEVCTKDYTIYSQYDPYIRSSLKLNVILVSQQDLSSAGDPALQSVINEFRKTYENNGINIADIKYWTLDSRDTFVYGNDFNGNSQPDEMDRLFMTTSSDDEFNKWHVNVYFVDYLPRAAAGIAGGLPGLFVAGTPHSGVAVRTFYSLTNLNSTTLRDLGQVMAHEVGHYLGLFHTSELTGRGFDPIAGTAEYHLNMDSSVVNATDKEWFKCVLAKI